LTEKPIKVSIVVPLYNEKENVPALLEEISAAMGPVDYRWELILVDDGSTDGTVAILEELQKGRPYMKVIEFRRNFGQTAAMAAGFNYAVGEVVVPMDGDLQNDPADVPRLAAKLEEGYDVVSGWRKKRKDKLFSRRIPSQIANKLIGWITQVKLHDYGCTMKAYRREVVNHLNLYGDMHRFIPALAQWSGATVTEMEVNHRHRERGQTKYGLGRTLRVVLDLVTVKFLGTFSNRPLHFFGGIGLWTFLASILSGLVVVYMKFTSRSFQTPMNRNPLLILTVMLVIMSVQFLLMGLLAEMMCRTYHESQDKPTYVIRRIIESEEEEG